MLGLFIILVFLEGLYIFIFRKINFNNEKLKFIFKFIFLALIILNILMILYSIKYFYTLEDNRRFIVSTSTMSGSSKVIYVLKDNSYVLKDGFFNYKRFFSKKSFKYEYDYSKIDSFVGIVNNSESEDDSSVPTYSQSLDNYKENYNDLVSLSDQSSEKTYIIELPNSKRINISQTMIDETGDTHIITFFSEIDEYLFDE